MTDKDKLKALLTEFGVGFEESPCGWFKQPNQIICSQGDAKIGGHSFFFTIFQFDDEGMFIEMGAWE